MRPKKILFLCTGNSCRSQIAVGGAKHWKNGLIEMQLFRRMQKIEESRPFGAALTLFFFPREKESFRVASRMRPADTASESSAFR